MKKTLQIALVVMIVLVSLAVTGCTVGYTGSRPYAKIILSSDPPGAAVYHFGTYLGTTPCEYVKYSDRPLILTPNNYYDVYWDNQKFEFKLSGYNDKTETVARITTQGGDYRVHAILNRVTSTPVNQVTYFNVEHQITTDPSGAAVYLNQDYIGNTPLTKTLTWSNVGSERYELRFEKYGFQTNRRMITSQDRRIHVVMQ